MPHIDLRPLMGLGLTNLEAEIYTFLLENSPATGYGIAKGIARPIANTYKALESLHNKGAIIIDDSKTRLCRAVPIDEFFDTLQHRIDNMKDRTKLELNKLKSSPNDNRIYQLQTAEQVISRFRRMFLSCKRVVVLDFFPFAVQELHKEIISAAGRGVKITMKIYRPADLPGVKTFIAPDGDSIIKKWPGQWANGVFDGEEYLLAFLSRDGHRVLQAVWSNNQYLSWIYYSEIVHEFMAHELESAFDSVSPIEETKKILKKYKNILKLKETGYRNALSFFINTSKSGKRKG